MGFFFKNNFQNTQNNNYYLIIKWNKATYFCHGVIKV